MWIALAAATAMSAPLPTISDYDVIWDWPSQDAAGSMPIGNGEVVLNTWVEDKTGDVMILIARTDALSEISRYLKLGRIRVHLSPSPFYKAQFFFQHLRLQKGAIEFTGGGAAMRLFVDSGSNTIYLSGTSKEPVKVEAGLENWRTSARKLPSEEKGSAWSVHDAPFDLVESADVVEPGAVGAVTWYHRNETSVVPQLWANQSLTGLPGTFDPLIHRTFGGRLLGRGFSRKSLTSIETPSEVKSFSLAIPTYQAQTANLRFWELGLDAMEPDEKPAAIRTERWWSKFWDRSWVLVSGDNAAIPVPTNSHPLRVGVDSGGGNVFPGTILATACLGRVQGMPEIEAALSSAKPTMPDTSRGITLAAKIHIDELKPGRILDKLTAGTSDGFLFDTYPGNGLRLIVGDMTLTAPKQFKAGETATVAATYNPSNGEAALYKNGVRVAFRRGETGSLVTRGYLLQRYVQACQGRGESPIKFNGGFYTVEPTAMGKPFNPDFRNWGDSHWFQNVRHMYHPMLASGDFEMMEPFFKLYERARPLAESRTKAYHGASGAYFPETMTFYGTYSGGDYGWDRTGHVPADVMCPWWALAWNQGPELVSLMLDRWDYTRDSGFLQKRALPMAESVLRYFDTRFKKDAAGRIVLDPTQVVETYWSGVVNDMPSTSGLLAVTRRLCSLPSGLLTAKQREFFTHMQKACPELPLETRDGMKMLAPAQKYKPETSNVENGQLYAVWPFQEVSLARPQYLEEAKRAYAVRLNHLDTGWGYDGNVAALLGMTDEASRILRVKVRNSHPAYRWPATWGPNYDWLPDQNHGGNLLETTDLMLLQGASLESGGAIRVLPAWPRAWDVSFKLHAPGNTTVECVAQGGRIVSLKVTPESRRKDVIVGDAWR